MPWVFIAADRAPKHQCSPPDEGPGEDLVEETTKEATTTTEEEEETTPVLIPVGSIWQCQECLTLFLFKGYYFPEEGWTFGAKWQKMRWWLQWRHRRILKERSLWR